MAPIDVAHRYFQAWNDHDPEAILATFSKNGTYSDPATGQALTGSAISDYARNLFTAFPDLSFELTGDAPADGDTVAAQWMMRGTNTGPLRGNPPTQGSVALPGADFITVKEEAIHSVQGYFDQTTFAKQLGLQVTVQPYAIGPVSFGDSVYLQPGNSSKPGAFSLTSLSVRSEEEVQEVRGLSRRILQEMAQTPGFISALTARNGFRMFTITAWQDAENPRQLLRGGAHKEAMERFFGSNLSTGAMTSVWVPERINAMWVRCTACDRMVDFEQHEGKCECGQTLPDPPPYW